MELTELNYYSLEAGKEFMSASQFKAFKKCQAAALAELQGGYHPPESDALTIGRYMDARFDSPDAFEREKFVDYTKLYTKQGKPRAETLKADKAFERAYRDKMFMDYMSGEHQGIYTGEIAGVPFKAKLDSLHSDKIVDLKYMKDLEPKWDPDEGVKKDFISFYGYDIQMAIYQKIISETVTDGELLPCFIAAITKEETPQIALIELPQYLLNNAMAVVEHYAPIYQEIKEGKRAPERCGKCPYCKDMFVIEKPMKYEELLVA